MVREREPLRNTFSIGGGDFEFEVCPAGRRVMGLVNIKNSIVTNQWGEKPAYTLVFRDRELPAAFVNFKQPSTISNRSNMGKALKRMKDIEDLDKLTKEEAFNHLQESLNLWYEVRVIHVKWTSPRGEEITFTQVDDNDIRPIKVSGPRPDEYFKGFRKERKQAEPNTGEGMTGFEAYADGALAAATAPSKPPAGAMSDPPPALSTPTSFEDDDLPWS